MTDTFLADFRATMRHFKLYDYDEVMIFWRSAKRSPRRARICYRAIARSL